VQGERNTKKARFFLLPSRRLSSPKIVQGADVYRQARFFLLPSRRLSSPKIVQGADVYRQARFFYCRAAAYLLSSLHFSEIETILLIHP
jgi:hypothetical protein